MGWTGRHLCGVAALVIVGTPSLAGCKAESQTYDTNVVVKKLMPVRRDEAGKALTIDVEMIYDECPSKPFELVRGDVDFAACVQQKAKAGEKVPIKVQHYLGTQGFWEWRVREVAGCVRADEPLDEASYSIARECRDVEVNKVKSAFECKYAGKKELNAKCPWFRRR